MNLAPQPSPFSGMPKAFAGRMTRLPRIMAADASGLPLNGSPKLVFRPRVPEMTTPPSERILIFDFGSQYGQLIARRVREQNVFCQIVRHDITAERVRELKPTGMIFSGGPAS